MTASVIRRLSCNRPGCPSTVTAPPGVDHLYALRRMARESGWSVTGVGNDRLDYCPMHAALGPAPIASPEEGNHA